MVGSEGSGSGGVVRTTRVKAINPHYAGLIVRELDVLPKSDGQDWKIGDEVGLHGAVWAERNDAPVYAVITEILDV